MFLSEKQEGEERGLDCNDFNAGSFVPGALGSIPEIRQYFYPINKRIFRISVATATWQKQVDEPFEFGIGRAEDGRILYRKTYPQNFCSDGETVFPVPDILPSSGGKMFFYLKSLSGGDIPLSTWMSRVSGQLSSELGGRPSEASVLFRVTYGNRPWFPVMFCIGIAVIALLCGDRNLRRLASCRPEHILLFLGGGAGIAVVFLTVFCGVPDEFVHFCRAGVVSSGELYREPSRFTEYGMSPFWMDALGVKSPDGSKNIALLHETNINAVSGLGFKHAASGYSPLMYAASATGFLLGRVMDCSVMQTFWLGRFCNLMLWLCLMYGAIRITPRFQYAFLFGALLPMTVFQGASWSADSFTIGCSFLFFAFVFRFLFDGRELGRFDFAALVLLTLAAVWGKFVIMPVVLLLLVPWKAFGSKGRKWGWLALLFGIVIVVPLLVSRYQSAFPAPEADPALQKALLQQRPEIFLKAFVHTLWQLGGSYVRGAIGVLGWYNIFFPKLFYVAAEVMFLSLFVFLKDRGIRWRDRGMALVLLGVFTLFLHLMLYLVWSKVGGGDIAGVQGRYFLPVLPLLFLVLGNDWSCRLIERCVRNYKVLLLIWLFFMQICLTRMLFTVYW